MMIYTGGSESSSRTVTNASSDAIHTHAPEVGAHVRYVQLQARYTLPIALPECPTRAPDASVVVSARDFPKDMMLVHVSRGLTVPRGALSCGVATAPRPGTASQLPRLDLKHSSSPTTLPANRSSNTVDRTCPTRGESGSESVSEAAWCSASAACVPHDDQAGNAVTGSNHVNSYRLPVKLQPGGAAVGNSGSGQAAPARKRGRPRGSKAAKAGRVVVKQRRKGVPQRAVE